MSTTLCSSLWFCCSAASNAFAADVTSRGDDAGSANTRISRRTIVARYSLDIGHLCITAFAIILVSLTDT
jgi:hypothetical protein